MEARLTEEGRELTVEEENNIFLAVNPLDAKGWVYGLGSLSPALASPGGSSSSQSSRGTLFTEEQVSQMVDERVLPLQEKLAKHQENSRWQQEDYQRQHKEVLAKHREDYRRLEAYITKILSQQSSSSANRSDETPPSDS